MMKKDNYSRLDTIRDVLCNEILRGPLLTEDSFTMKRETFINNLLGLTGLAMPVMEAPEVEVDEGAAEGTGGDGAERRSSLQGSKRESESRRSSVQERVSFFETTVEKISAKEEEDAAKPGAAAAKGEVGEWNHEKMEGSLDFDDMYVIKAISVLKAKQKLVADSWPHNEAFFEQKVRVLGAGGVVAEVPRKDAVSVASDVDSPHLTLPHSTLPPPLFLAAE